MSSALRFSLIVLALWGESFALPVGSHISVRWLRSTGASTHWLRLDPGGKWTQVGEVPGVHTASAILPLAMATSSVIPAISTAWWHLGTAPASSVLRLPAWYGAFAPFSDDTVLAHGPGGLALLTSAGDIPVCTGVPLPPSLTNVSVARIGTDELLVWGSEKTVTPRKRPVAQFQLWHIKMRGIDCDTLSHSFYFSAYADAAPLLTTRGVVYAGPDPMRGGQSLHHAPLVGIPNHSSWLAAAWSPSPNEELIPLGFEDGPMLLPSSKGNSPEIVYFRDGEKLLLVAPGYAPATLSPNLFSFFALSQAVMGGIARGTRFSVSHYQPALPSSGTAQTPVAPAQSTAPATPSVRFAALWTVAHGKKLVGSPVAPPTITSGDLVNLLEGAAMDSEWLDTALRQLGSQKYNRHGIVFRGSWSAPRLGTPVVVADFLATVAEAKSCGGTLENVP